MNMTYNPNIHHRRSIRLPNYDYSQEGLYFITICVQNHEYLFGDIQDGKMMLNDAGKMVEKWYHEIPNKFSDIELGEYIVMPNHFHCIIINSGVGAHLCVRPDDQPVHADETGQTLNMRQAHRSAPTWGESVGAHLCVRPDDQPVHADGTGQTLNIGQTHRSAPTWGEHVGSPLHAIIRWFKTMSTNEYIRGVKTLGWEPFEKKLWQRNYYEHIIRTNQSHQRISEYIVCNPDNWEDDELYNRINR